MASTQEPFSSNGGSQPPTGSYTTEARADAEALKKQGAQAMEEAKRRGRDQLEQGKEAVAVRAHRLADAVDRMANELDERDHTLASYVGQLARGMHGLADSMHNRSISDMAADAQRLAKRNPGLFLLGSAAIGFTLARFMKASAERAHGSEHGVHESGSVELPPSADSIPGDKQVGDEFSSAFRG